MSDISTAPTGTVVWRDLTVPDASSVRDFYTQVVGWTAKPQSQGDYDDYEMFPPASEECIAGVCHARGSNADLPAQWLLYVKVDNVAASAAKCTELGGRVLDGPRTMGPMQFCCVQDPAGAAIALIGG